MDGWHFDAMTRALAAGGTRRGVVGLLAALAGGGAAGEAAARRACRKDSPVGQCCRKKGGVVSCACRDGGTVCGASCCRIGQACDGGACVEMPEPAACVAFGEPCKNVGVPCCDGLQCGSGQGGSEVACWVAKTGPCASTAECMYGTACVDGICIALLPPPPGPTCTKQLGEQCAAGDVCCAGTCEGLDDFSVGQPRRQITCCAQQNQPCATLDSTAECCSGKCISTINGRICDDS